ncbi:hypothetical protein HanIR_Chr00c29g0911851 [Helianthus annuus]|nr:hypothetical protein HanIR_Chr00c29g0911851 [Helianthus annuus]
MSLEISRQTNLFQKMKRRRIFTTLAWDDWFKFNGCVKLPFFFVCVFFFTECIIFILLNQ